MLGTSDITVFKYPWHTFAYHVVLFSSSSLNWNVACWATAEGKATADFARAESRTLHVILLLSVQSWLECPIFVDTWADYDEKMTSYADHLSNVPSLIVMEPSLLMHTYNSKTQTHNSQYQVGSTFLSRKLTFNLFCFNCFNNVSCQMSGNVTALLLSFWFSQLISLELT